MSSNLIRKLKLSEDTRGMVLLTSLLVFMILTFVAISLADLAIAQHGRTTRNVSVANSLLTAEAGIEQAMFEINQDSNFAGTAETEFYNDGTKGRGTYQISVTEGTGTNEKVVTSTGRVYKQDVTTDPISERTVRVTLVGTSSAIPSVISGAGGLILNGSASITNSDVRVNGYIELNGNSQIGTQDNPVRIDVAHQSCPPGANPGPTYPQYCSSGQSISMKNSTDIYGTVCARNQTTVGPNNNIKPGNGGQGLLSSCVSGSSAPVAQPLPTYDRDAHIAAVTTTGGASDIDYNCSQWKSGQGFDRTWPANLQLNGNVNADSSCNLIITGDVYITGDLDIGGNADIRIAEGLTEPPVVIVDGTIEVGGSAALIPNSSGISGHFISFKSTAACNPNCTDVTGNDLYNSQNLKTIDVDGAGNFPGVVFHAYWSKIELGGSGTTGSAIGHTIELNGAGTIVFGTSLSTGELTWTIRSYQQIFN